MIEGDYGFDLSCFGGGDQGCIGKIHGEVFVLAQEGSTPLRNASLHVSDFNATPRNELPKVVLSLPGEIQE